MLYFLEVTTAAFVAVTVADLSDSPERRFGLALLLSVAVVAGALAWLAESVSAARDRRTREREISREASTAERRRLVERARA